MISGSHMDGSPVWIQKLEPWASTSFKWISLVLLDGNMTMVDNAYRCGVVPISVSKIIQVRVVSLQNNKELTKKCQGHSPACNECSGTDIPVVILGFRDCGRS